MLTPKTLDRLYASLSARIIFVFLQKNDCLPWNTYKPCQFILCHVKADPELPDQVSHAATH